MNSSESVKQVLLGKTQDIEISCDYETGERVGADGTFQITTDFGDLKPKFDVGQYYYKLEDVVKDLV